MGRGPKECIVACASVRMPPSGMGMRAALFQAPCIGCIGVVVLCLARGALWLGLCTAGGRPRLDDFRPARLQGRRLGLHRRHSCRGLRFMRLHALHLRPGRHLGALGSAALALCIASSKSWPTRVTASAGNLGSGVELWSG